MATSCRNCDYMCVLSSRTYSMDEILADTTFAAPRIDNENIGLFILWIFKHFILFLLYQVSNSFFIAHIHIIDICILE